MIFRPGETGSISVCFQRRGHEDFAQQGERFRSEIRRDPRRARAAVPYLHLAATVCGGWQLGRAALAATGRLEEGSGDARFLQTKVATAHFYADHMLPQTGSLNQTVRAGGDALAALGNVMLDA